MIDYYDYSMRYNKQFYKEIETGIKSAKITLTKRHSKPVGIFLNKKKTKELYSYMLKEVNEILGS